jgi:predicted enzyme related to lactoylglutathione lyase
MDMKLELVPVPVTDVDRAKAFYVDQVGFVLDVDVEPAEGMRVVQLTPPGSACYAWFTDPDGNSLAVQQMAWRTGDASDRKVSRADLTGTIRA